MSAWKMNASAAKHPVANCHFDADRLAGLQPADSTGESFRPLQPSFAEIVKLLEPVVIA